MIPHQCHKLPCVYLPMRVFHFIYHKARLHAGPKGIQGDTGLKGQRGDTGAPPGSPAAIVGGVTYHRWGNSTCGSGAMLVYGGKTGIPYAGDRGGASNYICMPNDPQYTLPYRPGVQGYSFVFGTEYENAPPGYSINQHNAPCAVCYIATKQTTIMIPAHTSCPLAGTGNTTAT